MHTLGILFELFGEILIAFSVIRVHIHIRREHRLDGDVYATIKKEQFLAVLGIVLMIIGSVLQL